MANEIPRSYVTFEVSYSYYYELLVVITYLFPVHHSYEKQMSTGYILNHTSEISEKSLYLAAMQQAIIWLNVEQPSPNTPYGFATAQSVKYHLHLLITDTSFSRHHCCCHCIIWVIFSSSLSESVSVLIWVTTLIAKFMGPTWGPSGTDRAQVGPILAPSTLLSGCNVTHWGHLMHTCVNKLSHHCLR